MNNRLKKLVAVILMVFFCHSAQTQPCPFSNIHFKQQSEVDAFPVNYPACTAFTTSIRIDSSIYNLEGLQLITSIAGALFITKTDSLVDLSGLNNVTSIAGGINFKYNSGGKKWFLAKEVKKKWPKKICWGGKKIGFELVQFSQPFGF